MFKDELKQLLARAINDLNAGHSVLALSALHDVNNRIERSIAADNDGKTEFGRVVRENASLRITLQEQAETITAIRANTSRDFEEIALLQAENDGLSSDLRKCQAELKAARDENDELIRKRSAATLKPATDDITVGVAFLVDKIQRGKERIVVVVPNVHMIRNVIVDRLTIAVAPRNWSYDPQTRTFRCGLSTIQLFVGSSCHQLMGFTWDAAWCHRSNEFTDPEVVDCLRSYVRPGGPFLVDSGKPAASVDATPTKDDPRLSPQRIMERVEGLAWAAHTSWEDHGKRLDAIESRLAALKNL